jgi:outer membrane protein OmpA-like peptidoglycan-associated protein
MMTPEEEPVAASEITEQPANNPPSFSTATPNLPPKKEVNVPSSSVANKILSEFEKVHVANGGNAVAYMLLQNIYFDFNQAQIKEGYHTKLDKIHEILAEEPALMLEITGYADAVGGENINDEISQRRSESVSDYLTQKGNISPDRLVIHAYGEKYPMASNDDENEGRELNRRVELKFVQPFQSAVAQ